MIKRGVIVARIKPGAEEEVARLFADSDATELPGLAGVRHRSLFVLDDLYIHYVETDDEFAGAVEAIRDHPLFKDISEKLDDYITPYDPETWKSPKDAQAQEFYRWEPSGEDPGGAAGLNEPN
jgi:cyclase